jgi:AcrR family transcriptional regulator
VPTPTLSETPRTRERILEAALALFAEKGYDATSMREIAEHLGITKAALYYHFDSKASIVRAMLADTERRVAGLVTWARAQPPTPDLDREVLRHWSDIMQAHGLAAFRFVMANRTVIADLGSDRHGSLEAHVADLCHVLAPADAPVEDQLRVRLALMSINLAGLAGVDIDADETELFSAARRLAVELLPRR